LNLNLNKEEARLVSDAIAYFFTRSKVPNLLLDMYPGADVKDILSQLNYIIELGEEPMTEEQKNIFGKKFAVEEE
jgi:hypothetical protein